MATILIVDDHESNRELLTTLLAYRNHRTVEARDGLEGLERARAERPDLVITDILMPTMDGYDFTRRLRADPELASIWVYSEPNRGTTVKVYLPRAACQTEVKKPRNDYQPLPLGSETVLLAEDDERVRRLTVSVLGQLGYTVLEAADGEEALEVARRHEGEIHLLFTDIVMPKMRGNEIAVEIRRARPGIKVFYSSGYTGDVVAQQGALDPTIPFLQKPFTPRTLAVKVREALDGSVEGAWPEGKGSSGRAAQKK